LIESAIPELASPDSRYDQPKVHFVKDAARHANGAGIIFGQDIEAENAASKRCCERKIRPRPLARRHLHRLRVIDFFVHRKAIKIARDGSA
jgi:hypothetical protein